MLIKWVTCRAGDREAFGRGQLAWAAVRGLPGFLGQCGGWSLRDERVAHIFGLWDGQAGYRAFMAGAHDGIAAGQAGTYESIQVRLFDHVRGAAGGEAVLRVAHGHVRTGRSAHVARAPGEVMLGRRGETEFLVLSGVDHDGRPGDLDVITQDLVGVQPSWTVLPDAGEDRG